MIGRNDPCWCGSGKKWKQCHFPKESTPIKPTVSQEFLRKHQIIIKNEQQIDGIRKSGHLAAKILEATCQKAQEGITTQELNDFAHKLHINAGAIPAPLHYGQPPYPKSICTSINEVICHGIPDKTVLKKGDIVNIDVTCILDGFFGDCSRMVVIGGETTPDRQLVVDVSYECLMRAVDVVKPGVSISAIGDAIEPYAVSKGCSVVNQFVGHGTGVIFHEGPQVAHYRNRMQIPLIPGMIFTIEPMINRGAREGILDPHDGWTARTIDNQPSAQWEHMLLVTENGHEILTPWSR